MISNMPSSSIATSAPTARATMRTVRLPHEHARAVVDDAASLAGGAHERGLAMAVHAVERPLPRMEQGSLERSGIARVHAEGRRVDDEVGLRDKLRRLSVA